LGIADIVHREGRNCRIGYNLVVKRVAEQVMRYMVVMALDALITWFCFRLFNRNPTTVGFVFLLAILVVSAAWGLRCAIFMAALATLLYNYFFLPPLFTFNITDPQNWIALFAFLVTAIIGSQLSERARREARQATQRRKEVERLYALSQQLLVSENVFELLNKLPGYIADVFGAAGVALFLENKKKTYLSDIKVQPLFSPEQLRAVSGRGEPMFDRNQRSGYMPLRMGVRSVGTLAVFGCDLSRETLEAVGSLVATAIERTSTMERLSKAEAAREGDRLRALLLDSVTHEFRTPLTAIKASAQTLLSEVELDKPQLKELATVINEESDRLNRLVGEAAEVAQLDARQVELRLEPHRMSEAVQMALQKVKSTLDKRPIEVAVPNDLPAINMDIDRVEEVLVQLLDNAAKYSPPETPIHISAELRSSSVITSIADHGPGIDDVEQTMIFEKFYRGRNQRISVQGTGMGLSIARAIVELHGGTIGLTSQLGHGSVFHFSLPINSVG
jgi:two-component system, OmpR family, sensor histidine kinase KdpD